MDVPPTVARASFISFGFTLIFPNEMEATFDIGIGRRWKRSRETGFGVRGLGFRANLKRLGGLRGGVGGAMKCIIANTEILR